MAVAVHPLLWVQERLMHFLIALRETGGRLRLRGEHGEAAAHFYLRRQGYIIVAERWRAPNEEGEVDTVAWHGDTLCFIEVKTRERRDRFGAEYTVDARKQTQLRRMARSYVRGLPMIGTEDADPDLRFDLLLVYVNEQEIAFELRPGFMTRAAPGPFGDF